MSDCIGGSINCMKIDKASLIQGKKGQYCDIVLIPSQNDQYGNDYMIVQGISKQRRDAGERGEILGNAKILGQRSETQAYNPSPPREPDQADPPGNGGNPNPTMDESEIPF